MSVQCWRNARRKRLQQGWRFCIAGVVAGFSIVAPVRAEDCALQGTDGGDAGCQMPADLNLDVLPPELPALFMHEPAAEARVPDTDTGAPLPFAINPAGTGVAARASLGTWRDYNEKLLAKKLEDAKALAPRQLALPKPAPAPGPAVDIWSSIDAQGFSPDNSVPAIEGSVSRTMRTGAGADYKLSSNTTIGVVAEQASTLGGAGTEPQGDEKLAAYFAFKAAPVLSIDTRTQWEKTNAGFAAGTAAIEKTSIIVAPRVNRQFALDGGKTIEPFLTIKHEMDLDGSAPGAAKGGIANVDSAGAGVTFAKPDAYSLSLTTDVEGVGGVDPAILKSQLQLKLPLR